MRGKFAIISGAVALEACATPIPPAVLHDGNAYLSPKDLGQLIDSGKLHPGDHVRLFTHLYPLYQNYDSTIIVVGAGNARYPNRRNCLQLLEPDTINLMATEIISSGDYFIDGVLIVLKSKGDNVKPDGQPTIPGSALWAAQTFGGKCDRKTVVLMTTTTPPLLPRLATPTERAP